MERFHYFVGDRFSPAELTAACLDGDLQGLGEAYVPADAAETTWMRARSLWPVLGASLAATRTTAAWVYGALSELPGRLEVQRHTDVRRHHIPQRRLVYRDVRLGETDVDLIGGVAVTTLGRTTADLARTGNDEATLRALLAWRPDAAPAGIAWIAEHPGYPGLRAARARLSQPDVTR